MYSTPISLGVALATFTPLFAQQEPPKPGVDLSGAEHPTIGDALSNQRVRLGDWIDRFDVGGFVAARYFQTEEGGSRPDGGLGIEQATVNLEAGLRDIGAAFIEFRVDRFYDSDTTGVTVGEVYMSFSNVCDLGGAPLGLKVGRFDLPFGEWYTLEDAHLNKMIGYPVSLPYQFDEGVQAFVDYGTWGGNLAITDGTRSRNSSAGVSPGVTGRMHWRPNSAFYASASGYFSNEAPLSSLGFNASLLRPVVGSATGSSPSAEVRSYVGCGDVLWQASDALFVQTQIGAGRIEDADVAFSRTFYWWTIEPTWTFTPKWSTTVRWSGVGTFDDQEGFQFEARPYGNGAATYGFDQSSVQRLALGLRHTFVPGLIAKAEVGVDRFVATDVSGLPSDTRSFFGFELVLAF